ACAFYLVIVFSTHIRLPCSRLFVFHASATTQIYTLSLHDALPISLADWRKMGITDAFGNHLANEPIEAALIVPSGHQGPAFLVYSNFRVIMGWSRSEFYAIAVGHLADRIAGAGKLQNPPPEDQPALSRNQVL